MFEYNIYKVIIVLRVIRFKISLRVAHQARRDVPDATRKAVSDEEVAKTLIPLTVSEVTPQVLCQQKNFRANKVFDWISVKVVYQCRRSPVPIRTRNEQLLTSLPLSTIGYPLTLSMHYFAEVTMMLTSRVVFSA